MYIIQSICIIYIYPPPLPKPECIRTYVGIYDLRAAAPCFTLCRICQHEGWGGGGGGGAGSDPRTHPHPPRKPPSPPRFHKKVSEGGVAESFSQGWKNSLLLILFTKKCKIELSFCNMIVTLWSIFYQVEIMLFLTKTLVHILFRKSFT
jgi:hypothetical protein